MDDYTLSILPLGCLLAEKPGLARCCAQAGMEPGACPEQLLFTGVAGYQLYCYLALVEARFGERMAQAVRARQLKILARFGVFGPVVDLIAAAADVGAVTTQTSRGEVLTPVEMTVALALLLGLPESPHYEPDPGRRADAIARMPPDIDWCLAGQLRQGRREIRTLFESLVPVDGAAPHPAPSGLPDHKRLKPR